MESLQSFVSTSCLSYDTKQLMQTFINIVNALFIFFLVLAQLFDIYINILPVCNSNMTFRERVPNSTSGHLPFISSHMELSAAKSISLDLMEYPDVSFDVTTAKDSSRFCKVW